MKTDTTLYVLSDLAECKTLQEVDAVHNKYLPRLSDNQKPKFMIVVRHAKERVKNNSK